MSERKVQPPVQNVQNALNVIYEPSRREVMVEMYIAGNLARCPLTAEQAAQLAQSLDVVL